MKKIIIFLIVALILLAVNGYFTHNKDRFHGKFKSELIQKENNNNIIFKYTVTNIGDKKIELNFVNWLEYNVGYSYTGSNKLPRNLRAEDTITHLDLKKNNNGRKVTLSPNEQLSYKILIDTKSLPKGKYEFQISLAAGNISNTPKAQDIFYIN